jgi:hypothetical protein
VLNVPSDATLTSIAMLQVNKNARDTDYIDYLRPFVVEVLRKYRPDPVQDQAVAHHLKIDFGLIIPCRGIQLVLARLRRNKVLDKTDGIFRIISNLPDDGLSQRKVDAQRRIDVLRAFGKNGVMLPGTSNRLMNSLI